jgi:hypothetical protein
MTTSTKDDTNEVSQAAFMQVIPNSETCLNGHPITQKVMDGSPWKCGEAKCEHYDGTSHPPATATIREVVDGTPRGQAAVQGAMERAAADMEATSQAATVAEGSEELRRLLDEEFPDEHDDSDGFTCSNQYQICGTCQKRKYVFGGFWPCKHPREQFTEGICNCGAEKNKQDSVAKVAQFIQTNYVPRSTAIPKEEVERAIGVAETEELDPKAGLEPEDIPPSQVFDVSAQIRNQFRSEIRSSLGLGTTNNANTGEKE